MVRKFIWFLFIMVFLVSCQGGNGTPDGIPSTGESSSAPSGEANSPYPYPEVQPVVPVIGEPYPEPAGISNDAQAVDQSVDLSTIPAPAEGLGVITGYLLVGGEGGQPYSGVLYLGSTLQGSDPSFPPMVAFSETDDPKALQDLTTGRFLFTDIKPGTYALILWTPASSFPIKDETDQHLLIEVEAGTVKDLGVIPIN